MAATEKIETARFRPDGMPVGRGGARPGSGRKPKPKNATLLERAYAVLDEATLPAVQAVVDLLTSEEPRYRLDAAKLILSKCIPDLQHQTGATTPTQINILLGHRKLQIVQPEPVNA